MVTSCRRKTGATSWTTTAKEDERSRNSSLERIPHASKKGRTTDTRIRGASRLVGGENLYGPAGAASILPVFCHIGYRMEALGLVHLRSCWAAPGQAGLRGAHHLSGRSSDVERDRSARFHPGLDHCARPPWRSCWPGAGRGGGTGDSGPPGQGHRDAPWRRAWAAPPRRRRSTSPARRSASWAVLARCSPRRSGPGS